MTTVKFRVPGYGYRMRKEIQKTIKAREGIFSISSVAYDYWVSRFLAGFTLVDNLGDYPVRVIVGNLAGSDLLVSATAVF